MNFGLDLFLDTSISMSKTNKPISGQFIFQTIPNTIRTIYDPTINLFKLTRSKIKKHRIIKND
jgi:hypothetical protein